MSHAQLTPDPEKVISPKVIAAGVTGAILTVAGAGVVAAIAATTPEHFEALGPWATVAHAGVVAIGSSIAGYLTRDPLRR